MPYYRLIADWTEKDLRAGQLLFPWRASGTDKMNHTALSVRPDGWGKHLSVPNEIIEIGFQPKAADFQLLMEYYLTGHDLPPHLTLGTPASLDNDLSNLAHTGSLVGMGHGQLFGGRLRLDLSDRIGTIAFAFARKTQGGALDGTASALIYRPSWQAGKDIPRTVKFQICDHEVVEGAGANHQRGWHPARCKKCGLDMSVDSGD